MTIFNSYVGLPEGSQSIRPRDIRSEIKWEDQMISPPGLHGIHDKKTEYSNGVLPMLHDLCC